MRISDWSSDVCSSDLVETLIASDLSRARSAGEVLSAALHVPLTVDSRWRELDFGQWDCKATGDIDSEALGRFWAAPDCYPPPGGERWSAFVERVAAGLADLPPAPTLVVTHGGVVRAALHLLCGFGQRQIWTFDLPYAALLTLKVWRDDEPSAQIVADRKSTRL